MQAQPPPNDPFARPPIASAPISVLLVARSGSTEWNDVLSGWAEVLGGLQREHEILLVNEGTDAGEPPADLLARFPAVRPVAAEPPGGFGAALRAGIRAAQYPLLCCSTADGQYDPADLKRFLEVVDQVDVVTGCRQWLPVPGWYRALELVYRGLVRVVFGLPIEPRICWLGDGGVLRRSIYRWTMAVRMHDPECSFRLFRRELFERLPIQSHGTFANVEILAKANFLGALLIEVPVTYHEPHGPAVGTEPPSWQEFYQVLSHARFGPEKSPAAAAAPLPEKGLEESAAPRNNGASVSDAAGPEHQGEPHPG